MKHEKRKDGNQYVVYCPKMGMERAFDYEPDGFCPICKNRLQWLTA